MIYTKEKKWWTIGLRFLFAICIVSFGLNLLNFQVAYKRPYNDLLKKKIRDKEAD